MELWRLMMFSVLLTLIADTYKKSDKKDGYVSLEVNPNLAHDTTGTVKEAVELWHKVEPTELDDKSTCHQRRDSSDQAVDRQGDKRKCNPNLLL